MFEKHREEKAREEAASAARAALDEWTHQMDELKGLVAVASGHSAAGVTSLVLKPGEVGVAQITNVSLIEERKGAGQWKGGSQGVSFPIGRIPAGRCATTWARLAATTCRASRRRRRSTPGR
ncbi:MAG: hypothetical protein ACP5PB_07445 [Acidimicrobiales bacterium]